MSSLVLRFVVLAMMSISLAMANGVAATNDADSRQNHAVYLVQLAARYEHAEGVDRDFNRAANLYCQAARIGRAEAQYRLGWMYANGRGVARNDGVAAALFAMAAAQGHEQSKRILFYVHPKPATALPACLLETAWVPSLKMSQELTTAELAGAAHNADAETQGAFGSRESMHAAR